MLAMNEIPHDEMQHHNDMAVGTKNRIEYIKFGLLILAIFSMAWWFASLDGEIVFLDWMQWFMGIFFLTFGTFKLIGYEMFVEMFRLYDIFAKKYRWYAWAFPFIELLLGMLYITNSLSTLRDLATIIVMGVGAYGVWLNIQDKKNTITCACLGNVIKLPLSTVTLVEDTVMASMALIMLVFS
jgi:hypothetical protein